MLVDPSDVHACHAGCHVTPVSAHPDRESTGADVTFLVSGEAFAAHRAVLSARSPVFKAELFGGMKEAAAVVGSCRHVEVEDMEPKVFEAMLGFIYTDTVPELDREVAAEVVAMAQHLLASADRYGLERLKMICERKLADNVTVDTAATTLALAEQHGCSELKARCVEFIAGHLDAVLERLKMICERKLADNVVVDTAATTLALAEQHGCSELNARCVEFIAGHLDAVSETEGYKHLEASCPSVLTDLLKAARVCQERNECG